MMSGSALVIGECFHAPVRDLVQIPQIDEELGGPRAVVRRGQIVSPSRTLLRRGRYAHHTEFAGWNGSKIVRHPCVCLVEDLLVTRDDLLAALIRIGEQETRVLGQAL